MSWHPQLGLAPRTSPANAAPAEIEPRRHQAIPSTHAIPTSSIRNVVTAYKLLGRGNGGLTLAGLSSVTT